MSDINSQVFQPAHQHVTNCRSTTKSLLLDLPAELRNAVYEYVLGDLEIEVALDNGAIRFHGYTKVDHKFVRPSMPLVFVNRQLHAETHLLLFLRCEFVFRAFETLRTFLDECTEGQVGALAYLRLESHRGKLYPRAPEMWTVGNDIKCIAGLTGLKKIEIVDQGSPSYEVVLLFVNAHFQASKHSPQVEVVARDSHGLRAQRPLPEDGVPKCPGPSQFREQWAHFIAFMAGDVDLDWAILEDTME